MGRGARSSFAVALLLLPALFLHACTPSNAPDGGAAACLALDAGLPLVPEWLGVDAGPAGEEPLVRFANDYYTAFCDGWSRCYPFAHYLVQSCVEQLQATGAWTTPPECAPVVNAGGIGCSSQSVDLSSVAADVAAVGLPLPAPELSYDAQAAAACLAAPWTFCLPLSQSALEPPACASVFVPLIPDGGACSFDLACIGGTCATQGESCAGTCVPQTPPPPYQPGSGDYCVNGAGCGDAGLVCDGVYCRLDAGVGASCQPGGAFFQCGPGLYCAGDAGSCQPQLPQGASCLYDPAVENAFLGVDLTGLCQSGLVCQGEALLTDGGLRPGMCQPPATLGQACTDLQPDELEHRSGCMAGAVCSCGVCVPPPVSGSCADGTVPCLPGVSACDYLHSGSCLPLSSFPTCWNGQQCASDYCEGSSCVPTPVSSCPG